MGAWCTEALRPFAQAPARHHRFIIHELELVCRGVTDRLMLFLPPGSAKSTYGSVLFPPFWYMHHPQSAVIAASHTTELAEEFGRRVRGTVAEHGDLLGFDISEDVKAAGRWNTSAGGVYMAAGVGKVIAGRRADLAIIDDPVSGEEGAGSENDRNRVWTWYRGDLYPRLKPGARVILIMTRYHEDDLAGRLLRLAETGEGDKWRVVNLPAIAEHDDQMGRQPGDALWPEWEDVAALERKRVVVGPRMWASQFQQRPRPDEGIIFTEAGLPVRSEVHQFTKIVRAWDLASTEKTGTTNPDWTVGTLMGLTDVGEVVVLDVKRVRGGPRMVESTIVNTAREDGDEVTVGLPQDPGSAGKMLLAYLSANLLGFVIESSPETGNKSTRAAPFASQSEAGNVSLMPGAWNKVFVDELTSFPNGTFDDQVDSASRAFSMLVGKQGGANVVEFYRKQAARQQAVEAGMRVPADGYSSEDRELIDFYQQQMRDLRGDESNLCARCRQPLSQSYITDGELSWHAECAPH